MASTRADQPPARSGIVLPPGVSRSKRWSWFRENLTRHRIFRVGIFIAGTLLVVVGAGMWLLSALLAAPPALAGLWLLSREFHWGHRLFRALLRRAESLWSRAKARPLRWVTITIVGLAVAAAGYWACGHYGIVGMG
jgi:hypothetical protein